MVSPMVGPEIMTKLGPQERIHRGPRQADNSHNTQHKANAIIIIFLIEIIGTMINRDRQDSMKSRINYIPLITLPLHLHSPAGSDLLSHSIMQLAEMQSRSPRDFCSTAEISNRCLPGTY